MLSNCSAGEDSWESLGLQEDPKEINAEYSLEGLFLKLKLRYYYHLMWRAEKDPEAGKDWGQKEKMGVEDEIVRQHHLLNGHEF